MQEETIHITTAKSMQTFGVRLAKILEPGSVIYLQGELGAGKTTLVRGILRGFNYNEKVKSPTFTLVEPYILPGLAIYHFDLYRLTDSAELELIGVRDYFTSEAICLIEWPERGAPFLPTADLGIRIHFAKFGRKIEIVAKSEKGAKMRQKIIKNEELRIKKSGKEKEN